MMPALIQTPAAYQTGRPVVGYHSNVPQCEIKPC